MTTATAFSAHVLVPICLSRQAAASTASSLTSWCGMPSSCAPACSHCSATLSALVCVNMLQTCLPCPCG